MKKENNKGKDMNVPIARYLIIVSFGPRWNKITAGKILKDRGYERNGNGFYYTRVRRHCYETGCIEIEEKWLRSHGVGFKFVDCKPVRLRLSPYP